MSATVIHAVAAFIFTKGMGGVGVVSDGSLFSRCKYNIVIVYIMCHCMTDHVCVCVRLRGAGAVVMVARSLTVTMCIIFFYVCD